MGKNPHTKGGEEKKNGVTGAVFENRLLQRLVLLAFKLRSGRLIAPDFLVRGVI